LSQLRRFGGYGGSGGRAAAFVLSCGIRGGSRGGSGLTRILLHLTSADRSPQREQQPGRHEQVAESLRAVVGEVAERDRSIRMPRKPQTSRSPSP
ncbi:MAG: hypothetical protein QM675_08945, partial [Protaetiibacter sp.]